MNVISKVSTPAVPEIGERPLQIIALVCAACVVLTILLPATYGLDLSLGFF